MRNILTYVPQRQKYKVASRLKLIWQALNEKSARALKVDFCREYENRYPKAVECLEEGVEDSIGFYTFEELDSRKISSTNILWSDLTGKSGEGHLWSVFTRLQTVT